jgi:Protein of unknown function (DUF3301)
MEATTLLVITGLFVLVWHHHRARHEIAIEFCKRACRNLGVQLLDDTVSLTRLRPCRDNRRNLTLCRVYTFDYTVDRVNREQGYIRMVGKEMDMIKLQGDIH